MNLKYESSKFKNNQFKSINDKFGIKKISKLIHTSDVSTINTNTNSQIESYLNENNQTNLNEYLNENINSPEIITKKFNNAFKALEQLILDDENNDNNNEEKNSDIKKTQNIPIPKLDFSDIFDNFNNSPVYIREIVNKKKCFSNYINENQN